MSSFQALATAIAAQVGTGNIAGCSTALVSGGPGAIFWMWIAAFFGMATIYGEAVLAQKTKTRDGKGDIIGGPVSYIREAFRGRFGRFLAGFFAVAIILALRFMGNMVQVELADRDAFNAAFGVPTWVMGLIAAAISGFIFLGGIGRIASFTEKLVPVMAVLYLIGGAVLLVLNITRIPAAVASIFIGAFNPPAIGGAAAGITVRQAVHQCARGLSQTRQAWAPHPHAHAMRRSIPEHQGEVAMVGVFVDTFIVLNMTALVILSSGVLDDMMSQGITGTPRRPDGLQYRLRAASARNLWPCAFCSSRFHDHRLVFLCAAERQIPVRKRCSQALRAAGGDLCFPGFPDGGAAGLESVRPAERHHGDPELYRADRAFRRDCFFRPEVRIVFRDLNREGCP